MMSDHPPLNPIKSSLFEGHHYDPNTRKLTVKFASGDVWEYADVPMDKAEAFSGSMSPGRFYGDKIKSNHVGRKVL
jgi:hypothetical protein